jgi:hypothetical protein
MSITSISNHDLQVKVAPFSLDYNADLLQNDKFRKIFEVVADILTQDNPNNAFKSFQQMAYDHFDHSYLSSFMGQYDIHTAALRVALYAKERHVSDIASAFLRALEAQIQSASEEEEQIFQSQRNETFPSWAEANYCFESKIKISWGGGDRFLTEFLTGQSEGYAAEAGKVGIFVTTLDNFRERDFSYATRTPICHFDNPCVMSAEIDPNVLWQVNNNSYEAVLTKQFVGRLEKIERRTWDLNEVEFSIRKSCMSQNLPTGPLDPATRQTNWRPMLESRAANKYSSERIDRFIKARSELAEKD